MTDKKRNTYSMTGEKTETGSVLIFEQDIRTSPAPDLDLIRVINSPNFTITRIALASDGKVKVYVDHPAHAPSSEDVWDTELRLTRYD